MKVIIVIALCAAVANAALVSPIVPLKDVKGHQSRIISGKPAAPGQFPYQALNFFEVELGTAFCGGALICDSWILTAGHCVFGASDFTIYLGSVNQSQGFEEGRIEINTNKAILHEEYNPNTLNNDVALINLGQKVTFTDKIKPIRLARKRVGEGEKVTVSGWGRTEEGDPISDVLKYVNLTTISNTRCAGVYGTEIILDSTLCAVGNPEHSTCNGDSGGPLVQPGPDGALEQVGVVSFVHINGCATGNPSGYVRVADFRIWIESKIGNSCTLV